MASCRDCIFYRRCCTFAEEYNLNFMHKTSPESCPDFKDKSRFVELPCKVGETVYFIYQNKIFEHKIREIVIGEYGGFVYSSDCFPFLAFGNYLFLTREEAEKALKERKII